MTQRLYYADSYQTEVQATVVQIAERQGQPAVLCDRTIFYPTSGGQPNDKGAINQQSVIDVVAGESSEVWHILAEPNQALRIGASVTAKIDWQRRYDHMQQHSSQHLLSQSFVRLFDYATVAVHFGDQESTLDLASDKLDSSQLAEAEQFANDLAYQALAIKAYWVEERDLDRYQLRRPPKVTGQIRLVEIDGFDFSACGGTHCRTTAELTPIKFTKIERRRGQSRVTFVSGKRALVDYRRKHQLVASIAAQFNTEIGETPLAVERLLQQAKEQQRRIDLLLRQRMEFEAQRLLANAESVGTQRVVVHSSSEWEINEIKTLAGELTQQPSVIALLAGVATNKFTLVFARSSDVALHCGNLLKESLVAFGGNGGGKPEFAQGGGNDPTQVQKLLTDALSRLRTASLSAM